MMKKENEVNACNSLIRILQILADVRYEWESCPDEGSANGKDVDFILKAARIGAARIAVEHTVVPLFNEQYQYAIASYDRAEEINELCRGRVPKDRYYVMTASYVLINSLDSRKKRENFNEKLAGWIIQRAPCLRIDESEQYSHEGYQITLTCRGTHPQLNGSVWRIPESPADLTRLQKEAFNKAVQHGLGKFPKYKRNPNESFTTVLLLEDVAGLNHEQIMSRLTTCEIVEIGEYIDYIIVLASFEQKMIAGYVWKEGITWHGLVPGDRRFERSELA